MGLIPRLLGLIFPACAEDGAGGLPPPAPTEFGMIRRPATPNTALAAPADFHLLPDIITRRRRAPPARVFAALQDVAAAQPRTFVHALFPDRLQAHYVARSKVCNFPDLVTVQVAPDASPILWSRSVYGHGDMGVNRARLVAWLQALDQALPAA